VLLDRQKQPAAWVLRQLARPAAEEDVGQSAPPAAGRRALQQLLQLLLLLLGQRVKQAAATVAAAAARACSCCAAKQRPGAICCSAAPFGLLLRHLARCATWGCGRRCWGRGGLSGLRRLLLPLTRLLLCALLKQASKQRRVWHGRAAKQRPGAIRCSAAPFGLLLRHLARCATWGCGRGCWGRGGLSGLRRLLLPLTRLLLCALLKQASKQRRVWRGRTPLGQACAAAQRWQVGTDCIHRKLLLLQEAWHHTATAGRTAQQHTRGLAV
jgi:hypothetical protein